jgi:lysophospholipase L1-like esterase
VSGLLAVRDGIPRFAARARAGLPATIVAFGTSMTLFGQYLSRLPAALAAETGNARIRLINRGLRGFFTFAAAFRVTGDVLPHAPDLVLIEFAHNDSEPDALAAIAPALDAIVAHVRAGNPDCEFAFVYLAPPGVAAAGPSRAMRAHEAVADYYGFPSFDLAGLSERLVAEGRAGWTAGPAPVLTTDGIHHTDAAAELIGGPFAAAFVELLGGSDRPPSSPRPVRDLSLARSARTRVAGQRLAGDWATGLPPNHASRNCEAYDEQVAEPRAPGAAFRVRFEGTRMFLWAMGRGALEIRIDAGPERYRVEVGSGPGWSIHSISPALAAGVHQLEATALELPLVLGDLFIVGRLAAGTEAPDMLK